MTRTLITLVGILSISFVAYLYAQPTGEGSRPKDASDSGNTHALSQLGWMQGTWVRTQGADYLEESWSAPEGDCMQGMFRWLKDGKLWMVELMIITVDDGHPVFRIRHFDRRQSAWEDKDGALTFPMKSVSADEVLFENTESSKTRGFVFARPSASEYEVRLVPAPGAKSKPMSFRFHRKTN